MNELQKIFQYEGKQVRTVFIDGAIWFVAKDICEILEHSNPTKAVADLVDSDDLTSGEVIDSMGRTQTVNLVNEAGLYSLVLGSRKSEAKAFKRWITHEVLPSINKHGAYLTPATLESMIASPEFGIKLLSALKDEQEKVKSLTAKVEADKNLVLFASSVSAASTSILIGELAKLIKQNGYDIGQNRLFEWMRQNGYLISRKGTDYNMPTQRAMDMGIFTIKETTINKPDGSIHISKTVKVTGKGQIYFVNKFIGEVA